MSKKKKIGLCIGGGGAKGIAALPIIEALLDKGLEFDSIAGTSFGAVIGAYLAKNGEVTTLKKRLLGMSSVDWLKLTDPALPPQKSLIKGKKFYEFYKKLFENKKLSFADLSTPLFVVASNIDKGRVEYLEKGNVVDALMASSAYPGIFPPYKLDDKYYVDGGIFDNLPYEILFDKGIDKVIAINLNSPSANSTRRFKNIAEIIVRSFDLMMANAFKYDARQTSKLFVFSLDFSENNNSPFGINDLDKKCEMGKVAYDQNKKDFLTWINN